MRIQHHHGQRRQLTDHFLDVPDAESGVEKQSPFLSGDEIGEDPLRLPGLPERVNSARKPVNFEPPVGDVQLFIFPEDGIPGRVASQLSVSRQSAIDQRMNNYRSSGSTHKMPPFPK
jgi:hypothetical protein